MRKYVIIGFCVAVAVVMGLVWLARAGRSTQPAPPSSGRAFETIQDYSQEAKEVQQAEEQAGRDALGRDADAVEPSSP